jgi:hypothetical protein
MAQRARFSVAAAAPAHRTPAKCLAEQQHVQGAASSATKAQRVPRASEITIAQQDNSGRHMAQVRRPATGPVLVCMYKWTDEAGDVWETFQNRGVPLWQVQVDHNAKGSISFQMRESFNNFLKAAGGSVPATLEGLERDAGVRLVVADLKDPDSVGFKQWRAAFYVAGDLKNFLMLLDSFFQYKARLAPSEQPFEVYLHPHTAVDIASVRDELQYDHYSLEEPNMRLPLGPFEAQPVIGKRIVSLNLQIELGADTISVVITGQTWNYRAKLDSCGVRGGYTGDDAATRKYFRVLHNLDVSKEEERARFYDLLGPACFCGLAMQVTLDHTPLPGSAAERFVAELREVPSLHFES